MNDTGHTETTKKVTVAFTKDEWGFLHLMRSLYPIVAPTSSPAPGYSEIIKAMLSYTAYSIATSKEDRADFVEDSYSSRVNRVLLSAENNEKKITKNKAYELAYSQWKIKIDFRSIKWANLSVFPKGNYIINLDSGDLFIANFLSDILANNGVPESRRTPSQILRRCIRFLLSYPMEASDFFVVTLMSNLYTSTLWFPHRYYSLLLIGRIIEYKEVASHIDRLSNKLKNTYLKEFEYIKKDEVVYLAFLKDLLSRGLPISNADFKSLLSKYWSYRGFAYMSVMIVLGVAEGIIMSPDRWLETYIVDHDLGETAFLGVLAFHFNYIELLSMGIDLLEITDKHLIDGLWEIDFMKLFDVYFKEPRFGA